MKTGSDFETRIAALAKFAGVAAAVSAANSRDAKLAALAASLGGLAGASHDAQLADAEASARTRGTAASRVRTRAVARRTSQKRRNR